MRDIAKGTGLAGTEETRTFGVGEALVYPPALRGEQVDEYFGTAVHDPYRWMEDVDSAEVKAWVVAENALTQRYLADVPNRETMRSRLVELMDFERFSTPERKGSRYFYSHNSGLQNQAVVYWQEGLRGEPRVLLDPNTRSSDGTVALSGLSVTEEGRLAAYAIAEAGSDWVRWHVREVETGIDLPDVVRWSKFSGASWLRDGSGFYYQGYGVPVAEPEQAEVADSRKPESDSLKAANYFHKVFFHRLGTSQADDEVVYERPDNGELNVGAAVTDDGRYLLLWATQGTSPNNELAVKDLERPDSSPVTLVGTADALYHPIDNDGTTLWVHTTLGTPNGSVIAIDLEDPGRDRWRTIVPESANKLNAVSMVMDTLIVNYLRDAHTAIELFTREGEALGPVELPAIGSADGFGGRRLDVETFFRFSNFTTPGTIYRLDLRTRQWKVHRQPQLTFDPGTFHTRQIFYSSRDGTRVPMFVTSRRDLPLDGSAPALLYGYGGFNISLGPEFSAANLLWMERGGVYAQPSLRGGGEYGEAWHEAGMKLHKQNVFDDFIAAAECLVSERYTSPERLAIYGGSNGGLLVAACAMQRPELFGAGVAAVGVMDMLRFDRFTIGWAWKAEYGSPGENQAEFRELLRYSPLHNVREDVYYPAMLILTADHDDRVFPAHSFKYTAAMQAVAQGVRGRRPVLIRVETRAGHGAGMPLAKRVEMTVDQYCFLARELGRS